MGSFPPLAKRAGLAWLKPGRQRGRELAGKSLGRIARKFYPLVNIFRPRAF